MDWWLKIELSIESFQKQITKIAYVITPIHFNTPSWFDILNSKSTGRFRHIFVAFSECMILFLTYTGIEKTLSHNFVSFLKEIFDFRNHGKISN